MAKRQLIAIDFAVSSSITHETYQKYMEKNIRNAMHAEIPTVNKCYAILIYLVRSACAALWCHSAPFGYTLISPTAVNGGYYIERLTKSTANKVKMPDKLNMFRVQHSMHRFNGDVSDARKIRGRERKGKKSKICCESIFIDFIDASAASDWRLRSMYSSENGFWAEKGIDETNFVRRSKPSAVSI